MSITRNVTIAAFVGNPAISEAVQRIAFTFGYKWLATGQTINTIDDFKVLYFNIIDKTITGGFNTRNVNDEAYEVCIQFEKLIDALKNSVNVHMTKVGNIEVYRDGSVTVKGNEASRHSMNSEEFEKVVEARNKLLGKKQKFPAITFRYNSPTTGLMSRHVALVSEDDTFLSGYDLNDGNVFKKFRKDRLAIGGSIIFQGFREV